MDDASSGPAPEASELPLASMVSFASGILYAKFFMYLYQGEGNKACRGADENDNNADYYEVTYADSLRECQFKCSSNEECVGIEYSVGRCEIWHRNAGIQALKHIDESIGSFTCMKYESQA